MVNRARVRINVARLLCSRVLAVLALLTQAQTQLVVVKRIDIAHFSYVIGKTKRKLLKPVKTVRFILIN